MSPEAHPIASAWGLLHPYSLPLQSSLTGGSQPPVTSVPKTSSDVCGFMHTSGAYTYTLVHIHT